MSNSDNRTLLEKLDHVEALTGTYYSETDRTYYSDAREIFAALRARLNESPDPIGELEKLGARLIGPAYWALTVDGNSEFEEAPLSGGVSDLRVAAARLLARVKGGA